MQATRVQLFTTPLAVINCPSRRPMGLYTYDLPSRRNRQLRRLTVSVRMDYAISVGDAVETQAIGPLTYIDGQNANWSGWLNPITAGMTGVSYQRSKVTMGNIIDGLSNTYLVGEENHNPDQYFTGAAETTTTAPLPAGKMTALILQPGLPSPAGHGGCRIGRLLGRPIQVHSTSRFATAPSIRSAT